MIVCNHHVRASLVDDRSRTELPVTLSYRADDPYAVTVTIGNERIEWLFSRELLRAGTTGPAGAGDVRLWPGDESPDGGLFLHLRAPSGQALVELPRAAVLDFLEETEVVTPTGTEGFVLPLDTELRALLGSEPD
jgi:hypothetical protein